MFLRVSSYFLNISFTRYSSANDFTPFNWYIFWETANLIITLFAYEKTQKRTFNAKHWLHIGSIFNMWHMDADTCTVRETERNFCMHYIWKYPIPNWAQALSCMQCTELSRETSRKPSSFKSYINFDLLPAKLPPLRICGTQADVK